MRTPRSVADIADAARTGRRSLTDIVTAAVRRAHERRDRLPAGELLLDVAAADARAARLERDAAARPSAPLYGVPFVAGTDVPARAIAHLEGAGAILLGRATDPATVVALGVVWLALEADPAHPLGAHTIEGTA